MNPQKQNGLKLALFGANARRLEPEIEKHAGLHLTSGTPDVVICFGGDGTLLAAELQWPGIPKLPIRDSRRGLRCIPHPAPQVIDRLASGRLVRTQFMKLECAIGRSGSSDPMCSVIAMNEVNVHMGHINSAVRFKLWLDGEPYQNGTEILGDGFLVSTPFGSTAYFNQLTRGLFHAGLGFAFKSTSEHTSHVVVPEEVEARILITRGPAVLAFDNSLEYFDLQADDELVIRKHPAPATVLTWDPISHPWDAF